MYFCFEAFHANFFPGSRLNELHFYLSNPDFFVNITDCIEDSSTSKSPLGTGE